MKMLNPEYKQSQVRLSYLHDIMVDASDAKAVKKYADLFVASAIDNVLRCAAAKDNKLQQAADEYRTALMFQELLEAAIKKGEEKEESYVKLKGNRR